MTSPGSRVLDMAHGAASTHILGALARLKIADLLADGPRTVADLAAATGTEPDLLDRLLRAAVALGVLERSPGESVATTEVASCLRTGPGSLRDLVLMLSSPGQLRPLEYLTEAIRGRPAGEAAMIAGQVAAAAAVTDCRRIVDVGGGHGTLLRALLASAPLARGVVLDLPEVAATAPAAERIEFAAGDFLARVPPGGDVYVLCHVLHDWDDDAAARILGTCRRAAPVGARLLIVEAVLGDQPGPVMPELLNLHLLVMSGGRERTRDQYRRLLDQAGWRLTGVTPLPSGQSILSAALRPGTAPAPGG
jgi:hypothetical protein